VFLGLGSGEALNEVPAGGGFGQPRERIDRLEEALRLIRQLWTGEWTNHGGHHYPVQNARIYDLPPQPVPILVAAGGPKAAERAGRMGDGFFPAIFPTPRVYEALPGLVDTVHRAAREAGRVAEVHVKIDTGTGRLGVRHDAAAEFAAWLRGFKHLRVGGLMTHFASADEPERDEFTREQAELFRAAAEAFRAAGHEPVVEHLSNSAATFAHPAARGSMVRPGGVLYGLWRDVLQPKNRPAPLKAVMSLRTRVALLKRVPAGETLGYGRTFALERDSLIATLPVGYADGYPRALSNRGRVIIRGRYAPVVGRVSMDLTLVDATDVPGVSHGDEATLLGEQGGLIITAEEIAKLCGTISYEITCGVSRRVPRIAVSR
jgi:alanine racemase